MNRRNTVSVTPAMGASTVAGATTTGPSRTWAGTRASAGMACSLGLSQSFFTVQPLPAMRTARFVPGSVTNAGCPTLAVPLQQGWETIDLNPPAGLPQKPGAPG